MPEGLSTSERIALAWRALRRGASTAQLRRHLLGPDGPGLEQTQVDALEVLAAAPDGMRMSDFAEAMRVDPSTATRAVQRLERAGLARRTPSDGDRRFVEAQITIEGARTLRQITTLRAAGVDRLLAPFDDDEREQFAEYLERFVASIDRLVTDLSTPRRND